MLAPACENKAKKNDVHAVEEMKNWKPLTTLSQSQATGAKEKENENSTSSSLPLFPYMVSHVCVCVLTSHKMNCTRFWQGEHPSPLPSAKCIVRRNLGGTFAHGCQKHASNPHYSYSILPPPQQFMWLNYEWPRRHSSTQAHWAPLSLPLEGDTRNLFQSQVQQMLPFLVCLL